MMRLLSSPPIHPRLIARAVAGLNQEAGASLIEFALIFPFLILLLVGAVDFGRGWYVDLEVEAAAEAGALYGVQYPSDTTGMNAAALRDAPDLTSMQSTATYGSECSDGSSATALAASVSGCGANSVAYVEVDTTVTYQPVLAFPGIASLFSLTAKSRMRTVNE